MQPCCYSCGDPVTPGVDALGDERDGYICAACIYVEFGYFPSGMTPADFNPDDEDNQPCPQEDDEDETA